MYIFKGPLKLICHLLRAKKSPVLYDMSEYAGAKWGGGGLVEEGVACH